MKKLLIIALLIAWTPALFSQETQPTRILSKEQYLRKSRAERIAGFIVLPAGITGIVIGANLLIRQAADEVGRGIDNLLPGSHAPARKSDQFGATALIIAGTAAIVTSVNLLISSGKKKRMANEMALSVEPQSFWCLHANGPTYRTLPSLSLKIHL